ncbi:MFS transporter [Nocardia sp. NPDC050630]|uniref:MFS transporter n=1 Tax=Nocardia sp. NPDC050630 TaxID=3364321 RepID=UPI003792FF29
MVEEIELLVERRQEPRSSQNVRRWFTLAVLCVGSMTAFVNVSSTITGLARIQDELHASPTETVWITSTYSLVVASLILAAGTLADIVGRSVVFMVGAALFTGGSVVAFAANDTALLIVGQAIIGIGGAAILPSSLAVLAHTFADPRERTEAVSIWAGSSGLGLAIGPIVTGVLLEHYSWHSIFVTNMVLGVIAFLGAVLFVPASRQPDRKLDPVGLMLGTIAVASLAFAIIEGKTLGYFSTGILCAYAVFVVSLVIFAWYESRHHDPMIDIKLFRSSSFTMVMAVAATTMFGFTGTSLLVVLYCQHVQGVTPLGAGVRALAMFVPFILISALAGKIAHRIGFKVILTGGLIVMAAGIFALRAIEAGPDSSRLWPGLIIVGIGTGLLVAPSTAAAVISVHRSQAGMASAMVNMFRQLGNVLGASVTGTILTTKFGDGLGERLTEHHLPQQTIDSVVDAAQRGNHDSARLPTELASLVADSARRAFTDASHLSALVTATIIAAIVIPTVLFIRHRPAEPTNIDTAKTVLPGTGKSFAP